MVLSISVGVLLFMVPLHVGLFLVERWLESKFHHTTIRFEIWIWWRCWYLWFTT